MPKQNEDGQQYKLAALENIKKTIEPRRLYQDIHGEDPERKELQRFLNRLNPNRSNPGADILGLCVEHTKKLHTMTLAEFFGIQTAENSKENLMTGAKRNEDCLKK